MSLTTIHKQEHLTANMLYVRPGVSAHNLEGVVLV
jgi:hypothetical protein